MNTMHTRRRPAPPTGKTLRPGAQARIYRDGETLVSACLIPDEGRFEVRGLPPGQYVARDELGGEQAFEAHPGEETATVSGQGSHVAPGVTGMPGTGGMVESLPLNVGGDPVIRTAGQVAAEELVTAVVSNEPVDVEHVPPPPARRVPDDDPAADFRAPGQAGTSIVHEVPSNVGLQAEGNLSPAEQAAVDRAAPVEEEVE